MVTIFTPTFNRGKYLPQLYKSLINQTSFDFEWIVVDDGSTDNTKQIISDYISQTENFNIYYFYQQNSGKHIAINNGVKMAKGDLFFVVDSDDYLSFNAVENIIADSKILLNCDFACLSYNRIHKDNSIIGNKPTYEILDCNLLDFRLKYKIKGDKAEIYKTDIIRKYPFPSFDGEKFCPEALVFNRMALKYKQRYINKNIYVCEYLPNGLTSKIVKIRMNSYKASKLYYKELYSMPIPFLSKIKAAINYSRFAFCGSNYGNVVAKSYIGYFAYIIGFILHIHDKITTRL